MRGSRLFEDDRHPVERDEAAQLADERLESLVEIERRTEGTCAACRRLEDVGTAAQLVTEQFGLYDLRLRGRRLVAQPVDKPAHDHPGQGQQTPWEDDVVRLVALGRIVESRLTPPFGKGEERGDRERHQQPAADPVADGRFDQQNEEELVDRRADLVLVDEDEGSDDDGVDRQPEQADQPRRTREALPATE